MSFICIFVLAITFYTQGCTADILMTQTPESLQVQQGDSATISCKASSNIGNELAWYHQKPGGAPKFIIDFYAGFTSGRYKGSRNNNDFSLTISNVQAEDAGFYHCQQHYSFPLTFGGGTKLVVKTGVSVPPSLSLLPPSREQLSGGEATLLCLLSGYSPQGAQVSWAVDGREVTAGVLTGEEAERDGGKSVRSSTLTLSKALWEGGDLYSCKATHDGSVRTATLRRTECSV